MKPHLKSRQGRACMTAVATMALLNTMIHAQTTFLSKLDVHQIVQPHGEPRADVAAHGGPMTMAGTVYTNGLGTVAPAKMVIRINKWGVAFKAMAGIDDAAQLQGEGVVFKVLGDDRTLVWESPVMRPGDPPFAIDADIKGYRDITLLTETKEDGEHVYANWADARVELHSAQYRHVEPNTVPVFEEDAVILTPKPGPAPRITGPRVFGVRPNRPFLFHVTATGDRPMSFAAENLPQGLELDAASGRVTGRIAEQGTYIVTLIAKNAGGETRRELRISCGPVIGLVPSMGWNSWNCFADTVTQEDIRAAAKAMVTSGLINHGWSYVVLDQGWTRHPTHNRPDLAGPLYDETGRLLPNRRFPNLKGLADDIHAMGLRPGIHVSPGPVDCGGHAGVHERELVNAQLFAEIGFDYLKYDVCSYSDVLRERTKGIARNTPEYLREQQRPWRIMREALDQVDRDIVYSISGNVFDWGTSVGANSWRTSSDIIDTWLETVSGWQMSVSEIGFDRFREPERVGFSGPELAGPGHFNDRDMLVVGHVGWTERSRPTRLTPNEQYTHMSLWCLLASPLMLGCDLTKLDDFTLNLLTNDEVLEVNQDPLARQAVRVARNGEQEVWAKDMEDGSKAVGLFNRGYRAADVTAQWSDLNISGDKLVRDLWRQKDVGIMNGRFTASVPRHGVVLVKIRPAP